MKHVKYIIALILVVIMMAAFVGCGNMQLWDTTYSFERAIIQLPNGQVVEGPVDSWADYEDGDQLQIVINGITYLVHSSDAVLISDD